MVHKGRVAWLASPNALHVHVLCWRLCIDKIALLISHRQTERSRWSCAWDFEHVYKHAIIALCAAGATVLQQQPAAEHVVAGQIRPEDAVLCMYSMLCDSSTDSSRLTKRCMLQVPPYYSSNPPRLNTQQLGKFAQETLFYMFYAMAGDEAQIFAADELCTRGWYFHKEHKV